MNISIVHKFSLTTVLLVLISVAMVGWTFYSETTELLVEETLEDISKDIRTAGNRLKGRIEGQYEDVLFLSNTPPIQGMLRALKNGNYDKQGSSSYQQWERRQQLIFKTMLQAKPDYLKLRFVNKYGQELVVVGREGKKIVVSNREQLQNKAHRNYVKETLKLAVGSVYLSEINLNREYGKISEPHQEVLRSATPIHDEENAQLAGLLLITAEVGNELEEIQFNVQDAGSNIYITNDRGGYLLHPDTSKAYGFDLGKRYRIQEEFPQLATLYLPGNQDSVSIFRPKDIGGNHVINFAKIPFDPSKPERFIAVGMTKLHSAIIDQQSGVLNDVLFLVFLLSTVAILLAIVFSYRLAKPIKDITQLMDDYIHKRVSSVIIPVNQNDEIGLLARSYYSLLEEVDEARANLEESNRTLESRVTERTEALEVSEASQRAILETVADAIITIDANGLITSFNPAAEKTFGYTVTEVMGHNVSFLMPKKERQAHEGYTDNSMLNAPRIINQRRELSGLRKDGSVFPLELNVAPMNIERERGFVGILRDITERVESERLIAESEERQRSIVNNIVDGLITIDEKGKIASFNPAAIKIFGYQPNEVLGQNIKMLMPDPYHSEHDDYLNNYRTTHVKKIIGIGREVVGLRKDGSTFPLDLAVSKMRVNGKTMFTGVVRDITERKQMDKMKNEFISTVSHELRTPLTSIRGSLGLLTSGTVGALPDSANEMLKIASNNTERLLLLINDILDIQKIESGKMSFKFQSVDLKPFIEQAIIDHADYGKQHGVTFVLGSVLNGARVFADKDRLMQVMGNLLSNAAKFSHDGDNVEISVATHLGDRLRISVTDYGAGIPDEFQPKLFERFTQSDSSDTRSKGGTGLGLSITKMIIEKHGGLIDFISKEGIGSTFYIELPELVGEVSSADSTIHSLLEDTSSCVLIVEDDPDVAALIRRMLAEAGFNSDIAYDAKQARELLAKRKGYYRLMTLDILLPGEDGISLLASLRKDPDTIELPVVVLSVKANEAKRELHGGALDVADWLGKPIDNQRLVEVVSSVVAMNHPPRVLHVEDEKDVHTIVNQMLKEHCELLWTTTVAESREMIKQGNIDLVLLDIGLPDGSGLDLIEDIEQLEPQPQVVIFSAQNVSEEYADRVNAVLVKSKTNNAKLLSVLLGAMK